MERYDKYIWIVVTGTVVFAAGRWAMSSLDVLALVSACVGTFAVGYLVRAIINAGRIDTHEAQIRTFQGMVDARTAERDSAIKERDSAVQRLEKENSKDLVSYTGLIKALEDKTKSQNIYNYYSTEIQNLYVGVEEIKNANTAALIVSGAMVVSDALVVRGSLTVTE